MSPDKAFKVYGPSVQAYLGVHGATCAGRLKYHITGELADIEQCLAYMLETGKAERSGVETGEAYAGQPLYRLSMPYASDFADIDQHLTAANEGMLGLHRFGAMTYEQYADIAGLLIDARTKLKQQLQNLQVEQALFLGKDESLP